MPLKHWVSINASVLCENTNPNFQFRYIDIAAVGTERLIAQPRTEKFVDAPSRARRVIKTGDTLLSTVRTYLKAVYHFKNVQDNIVISTGFAVLTPKTGTAPDYISYCVQSEPFVNQVCANSVGVAYPAISESKLGRCLSWVPTIQEQTQIARFLDWKTAQIKKFIRNKRRLVELLKEQKQNIINLAVTRGLNPDVRFKPSGVEWIGDIPEHWETRRLRTLAAVRVSGVDKNTNEGEIPVMLCNYVDVYKNDRITVTIDFMKATATLEEIRTFELKAGDVIITKDSESWEDIAVSTFVPDALSDIVYAYHLALIRPFPGEIEGEFLFRAFSSDPVADQFRVSTCGVTRFGLSLGAIKGTFFQFHPWRNSKKLSPTSTRSPQGLTKPSPAPNARSS